MNNLSHADDITLLASNGADMKNFTQKILHTSEKADLYMNLEKTKMMSNTSMDSFAIGKHQIEVVQKFIRLGSVIESGGDCRIEMGRRLALGRTAMGGLDRI